MAKETKKNPIKQTRKPNNPNKNEIEVSTKGNVIILDPEVPADQTVNVGVNVHTEQVKQQINIRFSGSTKLPDIVYDTYPEMKNGEVVSYQDETVEVYVDLKKSPALNNEPFKLVAVPNNPDITIKPVKIPDPNNPGTEIDKEGSWLVIPAPGKVIDSTKLEIQHSEYETAAIHVEFRNADLKPTIKYQILNLENDAQVGVQFAIRTWFDKNPVNVSSVDNDAIVMLFDANTGSDLNNDGEEVGVVTSIYGITFRTPGVHQLALTNFDGDVRIIEFEVYELGVGEYMKLNKKKLEVKIGEEKFIHCEVALKDSDIEIESDGIIAGVLRYRIEGNRIYVKATKAGSYEVTVRSPRYKDSKFMVVVSDELYQKPIPPKPETYYDLGELPTNIVTSGMNIDNFVSKLTDPVLNSASDTAQKICWALNYRVYVPYAVLTNMLCLANQGLVSGIPEERAKGAKQLYNALLSVVNEEDYILFKQQMLLLKLVFKHYEDKGLSESHILYNAGDVDNYEFLSHMVKFVRDDIDNKLQGFNVYNMNRAFSIKAKERLQRYVVELA